MSEVEVPQWKKDLIARLQSRRHHQQLSAASSVAVVPPMVQQPSAASQKPVAVRSREGSDVRRCGEVTQTQSSNKEELSGTTPASKMVMERMWEWDTLGMGGPLGDVLNGTPCNKGTPSSDSDSSEDLHYGPGIVNKLRNKYLSLALRESANRASILPIRKAASLENILDEADSPRAYQPKSDGKKNLPSRYRSASRNCDLKRARSVETISRTVEEVKPKRESMHEEMLITTNGNNEPPPKEPATKPYTQRINRPKRIQPLMNEREKPPVDVVKQARLIFERRPDQRTRPPQQTGDVAAKVASYKSIIVQSKPPLKTKPKIAKARNKDKDRGEVGSKQDAKKPPSPIPDVSRTNGAKTAPPSLLLLSSDTPDLIMTSSPKASVTSPTYRISATENFIREEIKFNSKQPQDCSPKVPTTQPLRLEILNGDAAVINTKRRTIDQDSPKIKSPLISPALMSPVKSPPALPLRPMSPLKSPLKSPASMPAPPKSPLSPPLRSPRSPPPRSPLSPIQKSPLSPTQKSPLSPSPKSPLSPPLVPQTTAAAPKSAPLLVKSTSLPPPPPPPTVKALSPPPPKTPPPPLPAARSAVESLPKVKNACSASSSATAPMSTSNNKPNLTILEIEKNLINTAKTMETLKNNKDKAAAMAPACSPPILPPRNGSTVAAATNGVLVIKSQAISETTTITAPPPNGSPMSEALILPKLPRVKSKQEPDMNNTMVFNFTDRKDVPDYVQNDGITRAAAKIERPKVGEGGITLLPGASIDESTTDEDDEILRSLEAPPSPCDVTFINDNILIDGKSSLSQKTKKSKMRIQFVEAGPEVFIYPSESSMIIEEATTTTASATNAQMGHTVPSLAGSSSLATYTPKGTGEEFQPGVTRSNIPLTSKPECVSPVAPQSTPTLEEVETPVLFSAGTNSDILF